jgi:hypothetical protein
MQEFCRYSGLLRHNSIIEYFARTFLAGCVKLIKPFLLGKILRRQLRDESQNIDTQAV